MRPLRAAAAALLIFMLLVFGAQSFLNAWQVRYLPRLAATGDDEVVKGVSLMRVALKKPDVLVLLGSSELNFQDAYHPARLFSNKPTGFSVFVVGSGYRQSIHNLLALAALDREVKEKRLVLFLTPSWFGRNISAKAYQKNFSLLQAYEFAFDSHLSRPLSRRAAARLLALGSPGTDDGLLRIALQGMAADDAWSRARYYAVWPLGRTALTFLRLKDQVDLARHIYAKRMKPGLQQVARSQVDWDDLLSQAEAEARGKSTSNRFGIYDDYYIKYVAPRLGELRGSARDESWLTSSEYGDMQLVLDTLKELGAHPVFVSLPVMGEYYDFKGHAADDRKAYYRKVCDQIKSAGFPVVDFGDREYEPGFMRDPWHPGWKGSVNLARTLDDFYHDRLAAARR